jgi:DNA mismatch repair protein MutS
VRGQLLTQYLRVKAQHQDAILLFRLGDFYEMFFEDAKQAAALLDLTLTARNRGEPDEAPLCGFPAHAAAPYVARLVAAGHSVAICEQQAAAGRGIMERTVVRVVTPGTIIEEESLEPGAPSLLVALAGGPERYGLAAVDFASGTVRATEADGWPAARDELERLAPRELLLGAELPDDVVAWCRRDRPWAVATLPAADRTFPDLPVWAAHSVAGALGYLESVYRRPPAHLRPPEQYQLGGFLHLDAATRRNLELLSTLGGERRGSLLWLLDDTCTAMGARRLRDWLLYPLLDPERIGRRLDAIELLVGGVERRAALREALRGAGDLERLAGRIGARTAGPRDVRHVAASLRRIATIQELLPSAPDALLAEAAARLDPLPALAAEIEATLVDTPPPHARVAGFIRAGHSTEVDELREAAHDGKGWLARFEADERKRTGIGSLKVRYNKVFGYYIEVTRANLGAVPPEYERKQTLVGAERFVTPALKEQEARVLGAEERLRALEQHLFEALLEQVAAHHPTLARAADALATVDALVALAEVAHHRDWTRPVIDRGASLRITGGRHPVVEAVAGEPFVPNDTRLDADEVQLVILTGPNMGGKSTYLRQVALITILAQVGSFVPAARAEVGLTDRVFTRVGASDNLIGGESTFMVEMRETAAILAELTPRSLVVVDELGRGTSTFDGISIAWAVAEYLHDAAERPRTLFATHYHELTALAAERERVRNLSVAVAEWNGRIVFLRQIVAGPAPRSYGVEVAALAGVPAVVVERARELLARLEAGQAPVEGARQLDGGPGQLALFAPRPAPPPEDPLRSRLRVLEPDRLTPLDALGTLASLVAEARRGPA